MLDSKDEEEPPAAAAIAVERFCSVRPPAKERGPAVWAAGAAREAASGVGGAQGRVLLERPASSRGGEEVPSPCSEATGEVTPAGRPPERDMGGRWGKKPCSDFQEGLQNLPRFVLI